MSKPGPLANFTETEKWICRPLYAQYITKALDEDGVLAALGNDPEMYQKFQDYTAIMIDLLKPKPANSKTEEPTERREILVKQIVDRQAAIIASRTEKADEKTTHVTGVSFTNLKC